MFCFVQTDADAAAETLDLLTGVCVKRSFDRISVDGQLSTSDTVFALANGASGVRVEPESADELRARRGDRRAACASSRSRSSPTARAPARVGRIVVDGRPDAVEPVARSIANSPLVKTALHGGDPNFGRILQAAGPGLAAAATPFVADLEIEGRQVVSAGDAIELTPPSCASSSSWSAATRSSTC